MWRGEYAKSGNTTDLEKECVIGDLAFGLQKMWTKVRGTANALSFLDGLAAWANRPNISQIFTLNDSLKDLQKRPSFQEAVAETTKRLRLLNQLIQNAPPGIIGQFAGGSINYGPFYNVHGGVTPSDTDWIVVANTEFFRTSDQSRRLFDPQKGFPEDFSKQIRGRISHFFDLWQEKKVQYLYQKGVVDGYPFSVKIIPLPEFVWEFIEVPTNLMDQREDRVVTMQGYKSKPDPGLVSEQRNFFGESYSYPNEEIGIENGEIVSTIAAGIVYHNRFYTGDHHNHALPTFDVYYDPLGQISQIFHTFRSLLQTEYHKEVDLFPEEKPDIMNLFDRSVYLSPQMYRESKRRMTV